MQRAPKVSIYYVSREAKSMMQQKALQPCRDSTSLRRKLGKYKGGEGQRGGHIESNPKNHKENCRERTKS